MATTRRARQLTARLRRRGSPPDLRDRSDVLTEWVVDEMFRSIPAYRNAPPEFREIVTVVVRRIVDLVVQLWLEQRLATRHEVRELAGACVPPTEQGISLEDMLEVFQLAQNVMWWELHRLVEDDELAAPEMALELSHLGVELITELSRAVTSEYLRGDRVWLQRRDAERALIRGILDAPPRIEEATRAAHALDLRLFEGWQCAVYEPAEDGDPDELARELEQARTRGGVPAAIAIDGRTVVVVAQAAPPAPPDGARCGVGQMHVGAQGMRTSHDEAREALTVARRRGLEVMDVQGARLDRVCLGSLSAAELAQEVLSAFDRQPPPRREMLLETLEAWLDEQGSATAAARRLSMHAQSVRYRVQQLREVLGDVLDDPDQRLQLHLAVKARRLGAEKALHDA